MLKTISLYLLIAGIGIFRAECQIDFLFVDAHKPDCITVPFIIKDSLLYVDAMVNGKKENFVLDNACPYLVINANYWKGTLEADSNIAARGVGGNITNTGSVFVNQFNWGGLQKDSFNVVALGLPHLDKNVCGFIGYDVFKDYKMTFDFDSSKLFLVKSNSSLYDTEDSFSKVKLPYKLSKHLPIFSVYSKKDRLLVGLDCGASQNILYEKFKHLVTNSSTLKPTVLKGGGELVIPIIEGFIDTLYAGSLLYHDMKFSFDDVSMNQINQSIYTKIDGLLGVPFLKRHKTTIDFPNQIIKIDDRKINRPVVLPGFLLLLP